MIVVDAPALVELLTDSRGLAGAVASRLAEDTHWVGPEHLLVEVVSTLRGIWLAGRSTDEEFDQQLAGVAQIQIQVGSLVPLLPQIRALARNATVYDAAYLALAQTLEVPLVTTDLKLSAAPGSSAEVVVISHPE